MTTVHLFITALVARLHGFHSWKSVEAAAHAAVRWLSVHTGIPALAVAAILVVVGWRFLKKSARLAVEIALVTALLFAATQAGWLRW